jgi:hypothetical protein
VIRRCCWTGLRSLRAVTVLGLLFALTLAGCGRRGNAAQSVDEVHAALLLALRNNDREGVLVLTVEDQQAPRADAFLRMVQRYMYSTATEGPYATGGKLLDVRVTGLEDRGAGKRGWSVWQYARKTVCHVVDLQQTPAGWRVTDFNITAEECVPSR